MRRKKMEVVRRFRILLPSTLNEQKEESEDSMMKQRWAYYSFGSITKEELLEATLRCIEYITVLKKLNNEATHYLY